MTMWLPRGWGDAAENRVFAGEELPRFECAEIVGGGCQSWCVHYGVESAMRA